MKTTQTNLLSIKAVTWLGLSERQKMYSVSSKRWNECGAAMTNMAIACMEQFGWDEWGAALNLLLDQYEDTGYIDQVGARTVWLSSKLSA